MRRSTRDSRFTPAAPCCKRVLLAVAFLLALLPRPKAHAQVFSTRPIDFGMTYIQERSKFVGNNSSDYFFLRGAKVDVTVDLFHGLGASITGAGLAATNLRGSIDIEHIQFLVGPRYTYNFGHITDTSWNRHGGVYIEGKVGYTLAPAGIYPVNGVIESHASALTYEGAAGINFTLYHRFDLRLIEGGLERTALPNGGSNIQNTVWVGSGINFHFGR
jgi:hypothetical protein